MRLSSIFISIKSPLLRRKVSNTDFGMTIWRRWPMRLTGASLFASVLRNALMIIRSAYLTIRKSQTVFHDFLILEKNDLMAYYGSVN
jgi:hypothetical protein